jgi:hypothetical protein
MLPLEKRLSEVGKVVFMRRTEKLIKIHESDFVESRRELFSENPNIWSQYQTNYKVLSDFIGTWKKNPDNPKELLDQALRKAHDEPLRGMAIMLLNSDDYLAIPNKLAYESVDLYETRKQAVYNFIIEDIPLPSADNPFEKILEFKQDEESSASLVALRNWISEVSKSNLNTSEIEEKYFYLKNRYDKSLKLHKMKTENNMIETVIIGGAEILENIARLKFSEVAKKVFKHKNDTIELIEKELSTEGNQLSYISKIQLQPWIK